MSEWISVNDRLPEEGKTVLLYWNRLKHLEDGRIYLNGHTGVVFHALFDGESLNVNPSHWTELMELPE